MAIWWREGLKISSSQVVRISGLSRNYGFSETQMGRGRTHGSVSIRKYITKNDRFVARRAGQMRVRQVGVRVMRQKGVRQTEGRQIKVTK